MNGVTQEVALADLRANPNASVRDLAKRWGWSKSSAHRFIKLSQSVPTVPDCPKNSGTVKPESSAVSVPKSCYLDTLDKLQVPRYEQSLETDRLITALNAGLRVALGPAFKPIKSDNRGSVAAANRILARVPLERAADLVELAGRAFNPSNTGDKPPRSLGHPFLTRFVFNESKRIERASQRDQLELLPSIEMHVERSGAEVERPTQAPAAASPGLAPLTDGLASFMAAYEEGARVRGRA